jgi:periplasmic divalent cation tolerance protein
MSPIGSDDCIVVLVTAGSADEGQRIAETLVREQLAACVNLVGPVLSVYHWDGQLQHDEERLLVIKTRASLFETLAARVRELCSYQTPEIIALPVVAGSQAYLRWLLGATSATKPPQT